MNMNLYIMEMRRNLKNFLIWFAVIFICIISTLSILPSFLENLEKMLELFGAYPESILEAFNIDFNNWTNILGLYSTYYVFFFPLLGAIFTISLGSQIVAKEEGKKTAEFLLVKPLSRVEIVVSKIFALFTYTTVLWILCALVEFAGLEFIKTADFSAGAYWTMSFYGFLMVILFGFIGMIVSVLIKRERSILGPAIGIVLAGYFFEIIGNISEKGKKIAQISPFHYLDTAVTQPDYGLKVENVLFFLVFTVIFAIATVIIYRRKDIYV